MLSRATASSCLIVGAPLAAEHENIIARVGQNRDGQRGRHIVGLSQLLIVALTSVHRGLTQWLQEGQIPAQIIKLSNCSKAEITLEGDSTVLYLLSDSRNRKR